jgi:hypothetical protein
VKNKEILGAQFGTAFSENFDFDLLSLSLSSAMNNIHFTLPFGSLLLLLLQQWWSLFSWLWMMLAERGSVGWAIMTVS